MKSLLLFVFVTHSALGVLKFREQGYIRLPYNINGDYSMLQNGATKARYHSGTRMLYVIGTGSNLLHIIDLTNPDAPSIAYVKHFDTVGDGEITDIQVCTDSVAVSIANGVRVLEGHVEFFLPFSRFDQDIIKVGRVTVGSYPKDMAYTSDCGRLVVVNEGKPGLLHNKFDDPQGSMTVITKSDTGFPMEVNLDFESFNSKSQEYIAKGVRYIFRGDNSAQITSTFSQDLEPESVVVDEYDRYAYISFQENNAIGKIDLRTSRIMDIYPLGVKNWTSFDMDASDRDGGPNMRRHQIYSLYQPRDIKHLFINGQEYLLSANTGAARHWTAQNEGLEFTDAERARSLIGVNIDQVLVGSENLAKINNDSAMGRLHISIFDGTNSQNLIQYVHTFGGRSISLWNAATLQRVYDTGDDLEREAVNMYSSTFNGDCVNINLSPENEKDLRSDDYGIEPTAVDTGMLNGTHVMVTGSRSGTIYAFKAYGTALSFQSVHRRGTTNSIWKTAYQNNTAGDGCISDLGYLDQTSSPSGKPMVYVIGSCTSSVGLYELYDDGITRK